MADGVDALMHSVQPSRRHSPCDGVSSNVDLSELAMGHHAMLPRRESRNPYIGVWAD